MWPFKRKEESSHEVADEEGLDEELRDVGWDEFYKEADLEASSNLDTAVMGPLALTGAMEGRRRRRRGLRKEAPSRPTSTVYGKLFETTTRKSWACRQGSKHSPGPAMLLCLSGRDRRAVFE
jgi:hypothetical protein